MSVTVVPYSGWERNLRLANDQVELIVTLEVGPRIVRYGFIGEKNVFGEFAGQLGQKGESKWQIRGGHRFWIAPEQKPLTYELDNGPVEFEEIEGGVRLIQPQGPLSGIQKTMDIRLLDANGRVSVRHSLTNRTDKAIACSPWALSVMAKKGLAIIPLPDVVPHDERLTPNQNWTLWSYTDLADQRYQIGSSLILIRQDPARGPTKIGLAQREGWIGYLADGYLFVKHFQRLENASYPDCNVNCEIYTDEDILELETLGPLTSLEPGQSVQHEEQWALFKDVPDCTCEEEVNADVLPYVM
ncbi:MAG: hypothetical protein A2X46_06560 [Lentisphaerae bacterium GWF2_57_35]|nr:MAG: hypothetical protein A2X46_06560 [Lentisphaerae bacterium GWF2_57_35]